MTRHRAGTAVMAAGLALVGVGVLHGLGTDASRRWGFAGCCLWAAGWLLVEW